MKWTRGTRSGDIEDRRGTRAVGRRGVAIGGGGAVVVIVVVLVARAFGIDISGLLGGGGGGSTRSDRGTTPADTKPIDPAKDPDRELVEFVDFVIGDIQDTFQREVAAQRPYRGVPYRRAKLVLFTEDVDTNCGTTSAAVGPFYCPPDEKAYIDLTFYRALRDKLGAPGDFAQAYVLAHEIGHHLQVVFGISDEVRRRSTRANENALSVKQELQADCFAGIWAHDAEKRNLIEVGDVGEAIGAAGAIGDDRLQKMAGRKVNPETFTHGSSEQRVAWWRKGYTTGRFDACDTFAAESP
jgi:predicted metalloprotease